MDLRSLNRTSSRCSKAAILRSTVPSMLVVRSSLKPTICTSLSASCWVLKLPSSIAMTGRTVSVIVATVSSVLVRALRRKSSCPSRKRMRSRVANDSVCFWSSASLSVCHHNSRIHSRAQPKIMHVPTVKKKSHSELQSSPISARSFMVSRNSLPILNPPSLVLLTV